MAYIKNTWVDQDVERPKTYEVTNNQDGSITLTDSFGLVTELGTPVNAVNMNHIEDGIESNDIRIGDLDDLITTAKDNLVDAVNEIAGLSDKANTDLSNLTATGKNNLVICANELDWTNAITVSTTISTNEQTYTTTADGVMFLMSTASGGSNSKFAYTYISTRSILKTPDDYGYCLSGTGSGYLATLNMFFKEGETITFKIYASGGTAETSVKAIFVPFKKA